jgi:3-hydroxyisobutyrate dehydrogenase-like beta-hydroxyacid dehydrogenase
MAKLGFLGLGIMGGPMAKRLIAAGHEVALWSYSKGKAETLGGGTACSTPREVAEKSDCVFLCVGDTAMSRKVIFGEDGLVAGGKKGLVVADCSTIAPSESRAMAKELADEGVDFLDAPCTGSKGGAEGGTLTFMVGGDKAVFERAKPWFEPMGKQFYYCGTNGQGLHAKLSQNMILGNLLQAFNESFVLSTKAGVPPELMLEIIENSAAKSGLVSLKAPLVFKRDWEPRFSVKWLEKDMQLMLDSAAALNVPAPLTALSQQMYRAAIAKGFGEDDIGGSIRVLEELTGTQVVSSAK